ncbi:hypothetical protein [Primorskyibacter sp. S187A]|uniref:hypothetical protein n=1 Tax=Primorskyibacter sp. S187A TaxID=3415130 RepID=UPI003C7B9ED2
MQIAVSTNFAAKRPLIQAVTTADIRFGAATRAGEGAVAVTGSAIVTGDPEGHWQISQNMLSPSAAGAGALNGSYALELDSGDTLEVAVVPQSRSVARESELQDILHANVPVAPGETIYIRDKGSIYEMKALEWFTTWDGHPSNVTFASADPLAPPELDYWDLSRTPISNVTFRGLIFRKTDYPTNVPFWAPASASVHAILRTDNAAGINGLIIEDCLFDGGLLPWAEGGRFTATNPALFMRGDQITNITFRRNIVEHVGTGIALGINGAVIEDNLFRRFHNDAIVLQNPPSNDCANIRIANNHHEQQTGWASLFHTDLLQFQPQNNSRAIRDIEYVGNTASVAATSKPAQVDPISPAGIISYTSDHTLDATDHAREIRVGGDITITLPPAAANAGRQFCLRRTNGTVTIALDGNDTWAGGTSLVLPDPTRGNASHATFVSDGSGEWKELTPSYRAHMLLRTQSQTLSDLESNCTVVVDASAGDITLTLPQDGAQSFTISRQDGTANTVRVVPEAGNTLLLRGQSQSEIAFVQGYGLEVVGNGAGNWTAAEDGQTTQGFFGNRHPQGLYENIRVHGNILYVTTVHGIHLEQDVPGFHIWNNTILRTLYDDDNGDGALDAFEAEPGGGRGTIWANGLGAFSFRDFTTGGLVVDEGGDAGDSFGTIALSAGSGSEALSLVQPYLVGDTRADYRPMSRSEVIASAAPRAGGPIDGAFIGAVGYYDFDAGRVASALPAPNIVATAPINGEELSASTPIAVEFDHFISPRTGTLTCWDVDAGSAIETFDIASGLGDNGGTVTIQGRQMLVTSGAGWPIGTTLALRITDQALRSVTYDTAFSGLSGDTFSWTTVPDPAVTPVFLGTREDIIRSSVKTMSGLNFPAGRAIVFIGWTDSGDIAIPTVSVGGTAASRYGDVIDSGQIHVAVYEVDLAAGGIMDVVIDYGENQFDTELAAYSVGDATIATLNAFSAGGAGDMVYSHEINTQSGAGVIGFAYHNRGPGDGVWSVESGWDQVDANFGAWRSTAAMSAAIVPAEKPRLFETRFSGASQARAGVALMVS